MQCHEISLNFVWINQNSYFVKEKKLQSRGFDILA